MADIPLRMVSGALLGLRSSPDRLLAWVVGGLTGSAGCCLYPIPTPKLVTPPPWPPCSDGLRWRLEGRSHARQCLLTRGLLPMLSAPGPSGDEVGCAGAVLMRACGTCLAGVGLLHAPSGALWALQGQRQCRQPGSLITWACEATRVRDPPPADPGHVPCTQVLEEAVATAARWGLVAAHQYVVVVERIHEHFAVKVGLAWGFVIWGSGDGTRSMSRVFIFA